MLVAFTFIFSTHSLPKYRNDIGKKEICFFTKRSLLSSNSRMIFINNMMAKKQRWHIRGWHYSRLLPRNSRFLGLHLWISIKKCQRSWCRGLFDQAFVMSHSSKTHQGFTWRKLSVTWVLISIRHWIFM